MSGKPASVGASRAGMPAAAPRVLVYVDPRQLEPGAAVPDPPPQNHLPALYLSDNLNSHLALPRNTVYRQTENRNLSNTVFFKPVHDNDNKVTVYGPPDNITQRTEVYPVPQQYMKDSCVRIDSSRNEQCLETNDIKQDCVEKINTEFVDSFHSRAPVESVELSTYQQRCSGPLGVDAMPALQQIAVRHGQNQYSESVTVQSADGSSGDRALSVGKSYVNYQILEQSVSHQSIVNQSISILNQEVGVSRGISSEVDSGSGPQLVRTADGVVLAVVPASVPNPSADVHDTCQTAQSESPQTITVPLGWRRIVTGTSVLYLSPSGTALSTLPQLREYLQTAGTCKCGLPCPLRPETAFSFDSKVVSKPYQAASGAELTKLCNHKRKLLATLQARAQSPATPPPQNTDQKKGMGTEVAVLKKKMKRPAFPANVGMSQVLVQRERPLAEFKQQESEQTRDLPVPIGHQRAANSHPLQNFASQHIVNTSQDETVKNDTLVQRSSHYLTVNNGWISHQSIDSQKTNQTTATGINNSMNPAGMPVLGTNGQVIGVNTGYIKHPHSMKPVSNSGETETKDERKDLPVQQNLNSGKYSHKEEESQIFCGLNQPLTPEVMQKINEQQQIFIQQNQKQIEMAMKGYKNQLAENVTQNKPQGQFTSQGQLVIQNGTVMKTNPAKTPPWQVKKNDGNNQMTSPNQKLQKVDTDYEEPNATMSEDSSSSFSSFSSNEQVITQGMCSRVPPLPQHYNVMSQQQWPVMETTKKKGKGSKASKKKTSPNENKSTYGSNGMRIVPDSKSNNDDIVPSNIPSFMDDPSGYLAQQTALLNNTISRQVGMNSFGVHHDVSNSSNYVSQQHQMDKTKPSNKLGDLHNIFNHNVPNPSSSPNTTPDSSVVTDKLTDNTTLQCCKGCNISAKSHSPDFVDNQMRSKYVKHNMYKMELDNNPCISSPKRGMHFDDNPVTSSTFIERNSGLNGNRSPIQGGTVSTSNVSLTETLQPPEPSPTLSNSSRSTDTPHSSGSNNSQIQPNSTYHMPSPAYSNTARDNFNSNPSTPGSSQGYPYNSPGPPSNQSISGTQMMHFISNHNINKNLMEVDNISMVGVRPGLKQEVLRIDSRRRVENNMPGYCPPPHLGGGPPHSLVQACYVQTFITTMASGFSVTRDTVTSVLAGKANTATTSINASQANFIRPPPPPSVNLATTYAIPNNQPDPFLNSVNLPTSYPLHIAGTTAQNMISKSPLEMVQNVIGSLPSKTDANNSHTPTHSQLNRRTTPGQILISSTGQIIVSSNQMPPPPPKTISTVAGGSGSNMATNVTASATQVAPAAGGVQSMVNQPTVVVNTLPTPFVIQPPMMAVDGQVVQQNTVLPQIVTGGIVSGQTSNENSRQIEIKSHQNYVQGVAMLSPESMKKRSKKKKGQAANITNVLQITAPQQNPNNIMVHSSPQQNTSPQFSPRSFQLSPNNNISPTPMLQALTIVPGKSGTPAHIVMNGQGNTNNFGTQQIITNTSPSQQINLLQPVNLINNGSGVMSNFPAFQQFIVPNLGGMVMTADGTAIIQDNSAGMPMQLQLQTVNGQNVLTPMQNAGVFAAGANGGVVIRAQNQQSKIIQSQHSPGAQFLSPNSQVMMNSPNFNGQLSPLLANLSPTNVTFNTGQQVRSGNVQTQEFIQTNQMGQALMVPLSPKRASIASATANRTNSTFVQNTTIVQQQTTLVSNVPTQNPSSVRTSGEAMGSLGSSRQAQHRNRGFGEMSAESGEAASTEAEAAEVRHSVSTQTRKTNSAGVGANAGAGGGSPPDTTTHSPLGALEPQRSPRLYAARCLSTQAHYADTTTSSPEPADATSSAMVQCVSSSEQDMAEACDNAWPPARNDFNIDNDAQNMMGNMPMRQRGHNPVESTDIHYSQNMTVPSPNHNPHVMPMASNFYDRTQSYKRKNDFGDGSTYRSDKIMRTNTYNMVHGGHKDNEYDMIGITDKSQMRRYQPSGSGAETSSVPKVFDRHNLGSSDDVEESDEKSGQGDAEAEEDGDGEGQRQSRKFEVGDLVWGPVKGFASWPGTVVACGASVCTVRWFGAERPPAAARVPHARLLTLSEGLEAHHAARTKHRKSRKLNTLLENAIQEAMAELDKKSEMKSDVVEGTSVLPISPISETPKRTKKMDKVKNKDKNQRKNQVKITNANKTGEGGRLRSSR